MQQLFDRSVELAWTQSGLSVKISPISGGQPYGANYEASGILQLVALLAAIHNDEIGALFIDEPEISLHPQHQAFVLEEMERVAGDPAVSGKKVIVSATHAPSLLAVRSLSDITRIIFFADPRRPAVQIPTDSQMLRSKKLSGLVSRLSASHRLAFFAEHVLLVEGPSDELVASQLAGRLGLRVLARDAQMIPVTGKGEFGEVAKLFALMNKRVAFLEDLDALTDDNGLVNYFSTLDVGQAVAGARGHATVASLDATLRSSLQTFIEKFEAQVREAAESYSAWSEGSNGHVRLKRVTLARLLTDPTSFGGKAAEEAQALARRYAVLLEALEELGCFFLRRGAIENYFEAGELKLSKPERAAAEALTFADQPDAALEQRFGELLPAVRFIAPNQSVDEDLLLRPKLSAILAAAFQAMTSESTDEQLNATARNTIGSAAGIFRLKDCSTGTQLRLRVTVTSPLFQREHFPFEISDAENLNVVVPRVLPGQPLQTS